MGQDGSGDLDPNSPNYFGGMRGNDTLLGGGGGDYLFSGSGNDSIRGGAGIDTIDGGAGSDTISGGAGNDTINGGAGIDLATYVGARSEYTAQFADGVLTLTHNVSGGGDGVDAVSEVERFQFADLFYVLDISKPELLVLEIGG
jgi:Ca2+-binding RTX toxin-like protein